jgi:hypothetical protein
MVLATLLEYRHRSLARVELEYKYVYTTEPLGKALHFTKRLGKEGYV